MAERADTNTGSAPQAAAAKVREYDDYEHTGPGTLMGRYLRRFWQPIFVSAELAPARAKPVRIMNEDFTLYRGESGQPYLIDFRCAHRGAQLSIGWIEGEHIHCRYHGWGYNGAGQCMAQPAEPRPFCQKVKIGGYPIREYAGLIFAYLGTGEPPPLPRYPELEAEDVVLRPAANYHDFSYFNNLDNDPVHVPFAHRGLTGGGIYDICTLECEPTQWGAVARLHFPDGRIQVQQLGMPNINHVSGGVHGDPELEVWGEFFSWRVPIDDEHGVQFVIFADHVPAQHRQKYAEQRAAEAARVLPKARRTPAQLAREILAGRLRIEDVATDDIDPPDPAMGLAVLQDHIIQGGQGAIMDRTREHLGRSDVSIVLRRKLLSRELKALDTGQPLTEWRYDAALLLIEPRGKALMTKMTQA